MECIRRSISGVLGSEEVMTDKEKDEDERDGKGYRCRVEASPSGV